MGDATIMIKAASLAFF